MNLYKNLVDNIKECELKLGTAEMEISFYYPESSLLELLDCTKEELAKAISTFCKQVKEELGDISIVKTKEPERYQVVVPKEAFRFVKDHVEKPLFLEAFLQAVRVPGQTLEKILPVFQSFGEVVVEQHEMSEWGVYFKDSEIDPYVYWLEEDDFGLEYHRFTKESYEKL